ncbi:helix-turn-helix transcriptional regulator [Streptomyces sp. NPDC096153]|uniref:helix-turn-helix transcriptional regulator n=1 Tax=Streptomyces sp. NPDC096153 TaxID=3155548 RepID=UPI0033193CD6
MLSLKVDGNKARRLRERRGLTVVAVADAAGCTKWNIYKIEKGKVQPSARVFEGMKRILQAADEQLTADGAA